MSVEGAASQETTQAPVVEVEQPREIVFGAAEEKNEEPSITEQQAETKSAGSEEVVEEQQRDPKGRFKGSGVQDRIDELTRARREAERDAEYWRTRAQGPQTPAQKADPEGRPTRENFQSDEQYQDALVDWKVDQRLKQSEQRTNANREAEKKASDFESRKAAAREEMTDFDDVVNAVETPVANHVAEAILEHPKGPQIMYQLAKQPEMIDKLNGMSPMHVAFELGEIAASAKAALAPTTSSKPADKVSKAPPPPARPSAAGRATIPSLDEMSMDDYVARRKQQGARWAR